METKTEQRPARTDILFEAIYRLYLDNGRISTEYIYHDTAHLSTLGYRGDFSEEEINALSDYFDDPLEFFDTMLENDPKFEIKLNDEEDVYISFIGKFKEETYTEGSWEEGYYDCLRLVPVVTGYEFVTEEDVKEFLGDMGIGNE